jgi:hypothetical protein
MSAEIPQLISVFRKTLFWGLIAVSSIVIAEDSVEAPELEFLEYLGSWDGPDEDWILFTENSEAERKPNENEERSVAAPDGEKLAELDDES